MIDFLTSQGLTYEGKQNYDQYGFSRENIFTFGNFKIVIHWMRNLCTIIYAPDGWHGAFTGIDFDNIRNARVGYADHNTIAFCYGEHEVLKLALPDK